MNATRFDTPEDAYFGFFEADAAQDGDAWAAVMRYPHARVAASGEVLYFETARDYADDADWSSRVATGWVRTRGREPVPPARVFRPGDSPGRLDPIQRRG